MKQTVTILLEAVIGGLILLFGIIMLFFPPETSDVLGMAENVAAQAQMKETVTENDMRMDKIISRPAPEIMAEDRVYKTGTDINLWSVIKVKTKEMETWEAAAQTQEIFPELLEITDTAGIAFSIGDFTEETQEAAEIERKAEYVEDTGMLCFYQSGSYVLKIKVTDSLGRYTVKQVAIPVEAG